MKLFEKFEAVRFPQENQILITDCGSIQYIYDLESKHWRKVENRGHITVENYPDVSKEELMAALQGVFPSKETAFMRMCNPSQLCIRDMMDLLKEDYTAYWADGKIYSAVLVLLRSSAVCHKSFLEVRKLLDNAGAQQQDNSQTLAEIKELCLKTLGRDIFQRQIGIFDEPASGSYFGIVPVRIIDYSNTNHWDNVACMKSNEISIEEDDVARYLTPFLYKYYDDELEANQKRIKSRWLDDAGKEHTTREIGFEWYAQHNYFTFEAIRKILQDIGDTVEALASGRENEFTEKLQEAIIKNIGYVYRKQLSAEEIKGSRADRPKEYDEELAVVSDFYRRFSYRIEYMLKVGEENGYNLISFMGL